MIAGVDAMRCWSTGLSSDQEVAASTAGCWRFRTSCCSYPFVPVIKQYNLISANRRWRCTVGKVTVGLASHRPCARLQWSVGSRPLPSLRKGVWLPRLRCCMQYGIFSFYRYLHGTNNGGRKSRSRVQKLTWLVFTKLRRETRHNVVQTKSFDIISWPTFKLLSLPLCLECYNRP